MRALRRLGSVVILVLLVVGAPWVLLNAGFYDWTKVNLWSPADPRILLGALTVAAWGAWAVSTVSLTLEALRILTSGRISWRLPGLGAPQALAGALMSTVIASSAGPVLNAASAPPVIAASELPAEEDASLTQRPVPASPATEAAPQRQASAERRHEPAMLHIVQAEDDLWTLAQRYYGSGLEWRRIVQANPDLAADPTQDLTVGTPLAITEPLERYRVVKGDTLSDIARSRLGDAARWPEIFRMNRDRISDPDYIQAGWTIDVPAAEPAPDDAPGSGEPELASGPSGSDPSAPASPTATAAPDPHRRTGEDAPAHEQAADEQRSPDEKRPPAAQGGAAPTPQEAASGGPTPSGAEADAGAVAAMVGGLSALAASAIVTGLLLRRRAQARSRGLGRRTPAVDRELRRFETALGLRAGDLVGQDPDEAVRRAAGAGAVGIAAGTAPAPDAGRTALIARAMRLLAAHWWNTQEGAHRLDLALVGDAELQFVFEDAPTSPPPGFHLRDRTIAIGWDKLSRLDDVDRAVAFPALVTLGADGQGRLVMIDLVNAGVLGVRGAGTDALSAMLVELTCAPWADELSVRVITEDDRFARAAAVEEVRCLAEAEEGLAEVERRAAERTALLDLCGDTYDNLRLDPTRTDAWAPWVVLFERPLTGDQLARLEATVETGRLGMAVVVPLEIGQDVQAHQEWEVTQDHGSVGRLEPGGLTLNAQTLPPPARTAIAELLERSSGQESAAAPWWKEAAHVATTDPGDMKVVTLRPARAVPAPFLRLFGPVRLEGAHGEPPTRAAGRCLEYCAWLLEHPGSTAPDMARALFVSDGTRRSNLSRLRTWLGDTPTGEPYLPDAYSGRIALHPGVSSDWAELRAIVDRGVNDVADDELRAALELVTGAPIADAVPGQWAWADGLRTDMAALVRDAGVVLARSALERDDADLARWACERALVAAPDDELLVCELMRAEALSGRRRVVQALGHRLAQVSATTGNDLRPETVATCQQLLEGRPRARQA